MNKNSKSKIEKEIEERFINLETKFSYTEDFVAQLQDVVVEQAKTIERLELETKMLAEKIRDLDNQEEIPNRKPPHY